MKHHKTVYSTWLREVVSILEEMGLDTEQVTAELPALNSKHPSKSSWVEVSSARRLWHSAFAHTHDLDIGFKVGKRLSIRAFNVLAVLLSHSPSAASAMENTARYQQLLSQSGTFHHAIKEGKLVAQYQPAKSHFPIHHTQIDSVLTAFVKALRLFISEKISLINVNLVGKQRGSLSNYEDFFQCPVNLNQPTASLVFPVQLLNLPLDNTDPAIYRMAKSLAEDRLNQLQDTEQLHSSVAEAIAQLNYANADINEVANTLTLTTRTLQRKLKNSGTSFRQIQEETIFREASRLLATTKTSIFELALMTGYTETSSFTRAIKKVSGMSPVEIRKKYQAEAIIIL
ncbi:MAG: AraC family transcriptional regulator ligand-binding domain-containing protein [Pseudomonadales bacterium]|nr:AraC family transcriptional regulator ligand-binding domain-containing protein [Pseudomonadales bacterium]